MIDAKGLRIGNILQYANDTRLKEDRIGKHFRVSADDIVHFYKNLVDYVVYPALTPDFLINNGFASTSNSDGIVEFSQKGLCIYKMEGEDFFRYDNSESFVTIRYIHQLQNLYFAVVGVELEVEI